MNIAYVRAGERLCVCFDLVPDLRPPQVRLLVHVVGLLAEAIMGEDDVRLESKRYYRDDTMERGERSERREQRMAEKR